jgi:probable rRNA maturation factor
MPTKKASRKNRFSVQLAVPRRGVPSAAALRRWARAAKVGLKHVNLRVVGGREARLLNRTFRKKDRSTNVLSFSYGKEGDVVLCHPVIAREARAQRKTLAAHYAHLVVHGMLHLGGYEHGNKAQASRMEAAEIRLLAGLGFRDPYKIE